MPARPGFWCQNRGGQNPNLSKAEFDTFAADAARLLKDVPALDTPEEVAAAVCNTGNQFARHLAALALNLAAETVELDTPLQGERAPHGTVGDAFEAAVGHLLGRRSTGRLRGGGAQLIGLTDLILCEVLQGVRDDIVAKDVERQLLKLGDLTESITERIPSPASLAVCFRAIVAAEMDLRAALALKSGRSGSRGSGGLYVETG